MRSVIIFLAAGVLFLHAALSGTEGGTAAAPDEERSVADATHLVRHLVTIMMDETQSFERRTSASEKLASILNSIDHKAVMQASLVRRPDYNVKDVNMQFDFPLDGPAYAMFESSQAVEVALDAIASSDDPMVHDAAFISLNYALVGGLKLPGSLREQVLCSIFRQERDARKAAGRPPGEVDRFNRAIEIAIAYCDFAKMVEQVIEKQKSPVIDP
jgi:hypothetical protein